MSGAHGVQFFDGSDSLAGAVSTFLAQGLEKGERLLLLARPIHVKAIADGLAEQGHSLETLTRDGRLLLLDARETLLGLVHNGRISQSAFETLIATPVRAAAARGPIRAFGELVDMLALDDNLPASDELEALWNQLVAATPLTLLCGYTSATFADPRCGQTMPAICARHTHVQQREDDLLANWLLARHTASIS